MFYADLEADILHQDMASMRADLEEKTETFRILGRY
jgi:prephenate dehydratase